MNEKDEFPDFLEWVKTEGIKRHAECIIEYCKSHRSCSECSFFNGVCRFCNIPENWDL